VRQWWQRRKVGEKAAIITTAGVIIAATIGLWKSPSGGVAQNLESKAHSSIQDVHFTPVNASGGHNFVNIINNSYYYSITNQNVDGLIYIFSEHSSMQDEYPGGVAAIDVLVGSKALKQRQRFWRFGETGEVVRIDSGVKFRVDNTNAFYTIKYRYSCFGGGKHKSTRLWLSGDKDTKVTRVYESCGLSENRLGQQQFVARDDVVVSDLSPDWYSLVLFYCSDSAGPVRFEDRELSISVFRPDAH